MSATPRLLALYVAALLLIAPLLVLFVAGILWLLDQGWLLWWLLAAAGMTALVWSADRWRRWRQRIAIATTSDEPLTEGDPGWAPRELLAWNTVQALSANADATVLTDRERLLGVARETIDAVAHHYHPGLDDPALEFTLPELLLLTERVSARMRQLLIEHVPLADRISVRQLALAWGYGPTLSTAMKHGRRAYGLLRILRAMSPLGALLGELRDRMVDQLYSELDSHVRRKIVRLWVEEVGRAAIDLYSGRLRVDEHSVRSAAEREGLGTVAQQAAAPGALRLLVAGQTKAGKSTTVNALLGDLAAGVDVLPLTREFEGYELLQDGAPAVSLIDTPGIESAAGSIEVAKRAAECDLIIWVVAAHRADRALDRTALDALRAQFSADPARRMPPLVIVASHIDRLSPAREWTPPYDVDDPSTAKEKSMRAALDAISTDLLVPVETVVPTRLDAQPPYNLDLLKMHLAGLVTEAQRARWLRIHKEVSTQRDWRALGRQLAGAGRMVGRLLGR